MRWYDTVFYVLSVVTFILTVLIYVGITHKHIRRIAEKKIFDASRAWPLIRAVPAMIARKIVGILRRAWPTVLIIAVLAVTASGLIAAIAEIIAREPVWEIMMKAVIIVGILLATVTVAISARR